MVDAFCFYCQILMDENNSHANNKEIEWGIASLIRNILKYDPIKIVFTIAFLHTIVSILLSLYILYLYVIYGDVSIQILAVLAIWSVGALVILSLGYIGKDISKQIRK